MINFLALDRRYMAEILPIRRKTLSNQSFLDLEKVKNFYMPCHFGDYHILVQFQIKLFNSEEYDDDDDDDDDDDWMKFYAVSAIFHIDDDDFGDDGHDDDDKNYENDRNF